MPIPTLDYECASAAGFAWNPPCERKPLGHWSALDGARVKGIDAVGTVAYAEHPTTIVLTVSYDLCDGRGMRRWRPGQPLPQDLFDHGATPGNVLESHKAMFERMIWTHVCCRLYGWPPLPPRVQRCSMATAHVNQYPGALAKLGDVLKLSTRKDKEGDRLIKKFSIPRDPTKNDPRLWIRPEDDPADFERFCAYCDTDVRSEQEAADTMEPMSADELEFWLIDQEINSRGMAIDRAGVRACIVILRQVQARYGEECKAITGGIGPTQVEALRGWLAGRSVFLNALDSEAVDEALSRPDLPADARRVLETRALTGSASVKKLFAMENQCSRDDRLRDIIVHHGARTGRPTGEGPQPLNLPRTGPQLVTCPCGKPYSTDSNDYCPWCGEGPGAHWDRKAWTPDMIEPVLEIMALGSLDMVERFFGDALLSISGCLRGLFVAGTVTDRMITDGTPFAWGPVTPGTPMDLLASDYSAIEAVVAACLSGEQWRIEAFQRRDPIYLVGAAKITGTPLAVYLDYFEQHGEHHKDRQKIGKVSELACGFGGWIGSYKAFGSQEDDATIKAQILAWRAASPAIVEMWGGQWRGLPWDQNRYRELYGVEGMAIAAIQSPGTWFHYRGIGFILWHGTLLVRLLSGRDLKYRNARVVPSARRDGDLSIVYDTWNSNPKYGALGWGPMETYGGRLFENIVQATAACIQRYSIKGLRAAGYPMVLWVYDENVAEVPEGFGTLEEFERIMATMPPWASLPDGSLWPIAATGGWRGKRYRKG